MGCGILKMVDHKNPYFWPNSNIDKRNHCILRIQGAPICPKLGMILENKVVQKLKLEKKCFYLKLWNHHCTSKIRWLMKKSYKFVVIWQVFLVSWMHSLFMIIFCKNIYTVWSIEIVPSGGPPLKMRGPPLEFINIQPKKRGVRL